MLPFNIRINGVVISVKDGNTIQNAEFRNVMIQTLFFKLLQFQ